MFENNKNTINISCLTHFEPKNKFKAQKWEEAIIHSDYLIAISDFTYKQALDCGVNPSKISIIRYGVSDFYKPRFNVLIVGSSGKRKGRDFLNQVRCLTEEDESIIWKSASEPGWGTEIICKDPSNLNLAYDWADLLVVPSDLEGAHTGSLEALFCGVPVLSRQVGWNSSELKSYVQIIDSPKMAAKFILGMSKAKNQKIFKNNKNLIDLGFSYQNWREQHKKVFNKFA